MVWIAIVILLVLLAIMPIKLMIGYAMQGVSLKLGIGFLTFSILPRRRQEKKKAKSEAKSDKPMATDGKKTEKSSKTGFKEYLPLLRIVLDLLTRLRSKLVMKRLDLSLILAGDDPCDLAVLYGRTQGVVAVLLSQIENAFHIQKRNVRIACDFTANKTLVECFADISISFGKLLYLAVKYGLMILKEYLAILKNKKAVQ